MQSTFSIIGTAGHIDHGKTALVKALTGQDTDRLEEEKKRGITIELGFAALEINPGRKAGLVDVPGHERFIRNMLAGVAGIDVIMLVVAANDGVMPQTKEHLEILKLLGLKQGVIVLTKSDLVDEEWLELVEEDVRLAVKGTFLEDAQMLTVSSVTGQGIPELLRELERLLDLVEQRNVTGTVKMPIDRVFTVSGFGTVVTGTLWRGTVHTGETLSVYPHDIKVRIRSIEVHGEQVEAAFAGQRTALNITGVDRNLIVRGSLLASSDTLQTTELLDVRIALLPDTPRDLKNGDRVRFYCGTSEIMARVVLLDRDRLQPGNDALAQIRLEESVACEAQDRFIIRSYSPVFTIGGGTVIDPSPKRLHRRNRDSILQAIEQQEKSDAKVRMIRFLEEHPFIEQQPMFDTCMQLQMAETNEDLLHAFKNMEMQGDIIQISNSGSMSLYAGYKWLAERLSELAAVSNEYYKQRRFDVWIPRHHIFQQWSDWKSDVCEQILQYACEKGIIERKNETYKLTGYAPMFTKSELQIQQMIEQLLQEKRFQPPTQDELEQQWKEKERTVRDMLGYLRHIGKIAEIDKKLWLSQQTIFEGIQTVREIYAEKGSITVAEFRDKVGTSRKYAVAFLEYLDRQKVTRREGDARICL